MVALLSEKGNIDPLARGFYYAATGKDKWDGRSLELPKRFIQTAIDSAAALIPTPGPALTASVIEAQGGAHDENLVLADWVQLDGFSTVIRSDEPTSVVAASFLAFRVQTIINTCPDGVCLDITDVLSFGSNITFMAVSGVDGVGIKIDGDCDELFLTLSEIQMRGLRSIGYHVTAVSPTPIDINKNVALLVGDDTVFVKWEQPNAADTGTIDISTVVSQGSNTTALWVVNGSLSVDAQTIRADQAVLVEDEGSLGLDCELLDGDVTIRTGGRAILKSIGILIGDIVVEAGAELEIIASPHFGTITNNGTIHGIINGVDYGKYIQVVQSIESLAVSATNADFDAAPVTKLNESRNTSAGLAQVTFSFNATADVTNRRAVVALYIDNVLIDDEFEMEPKDILNNPFPCKAFEHNFTEGSHDFRVEFGKRGGAGSGIVTLKNVRIIVREV